MKRLSLLLGLVLLGAMVVSCGSSNDDDAANQDASTDASGAFDGAEDDAQGRDENAERCSEGAKKCLDGVEAQCEGGAWKAGRRCWDEGLACSDTAGCQQACETDADCGNVDQIDGRYCRKTKKGNACASKVFETVWDVGDDDKTILLPQYGGDSCKVRILWGDEPEGTPFGEEIDCTDVSQIEHTYAKKGIYHIRIVGKYNAWGQSGTNDFLTTRLVRIESFGQAVLTQYAFAGAADLQIAKGEAPDPTHWTNAEGLFAWSERFNAEIGDWDTSNVTQMTSMFALALAFNQDLNGWDTSNVMRMDSLFNGAVSFNGDISGWDTSNVTRMDSLFNGAVSFNGDISSWDTSNVIRMDHMFSEANAFNQPIGGWKTGKVTDMSRMFSDAFEFNQDINEWDTSNVVLMEYMFNQARSFNRSIGSWDMSNVQDAQSMFYGATMFNQPLPDWDLKSATQLGSMFGGALRFNQDLATWKFGKDVDFSLFFTDSGINKANYCAFKQRVKDITEQDQDLGQPLDGAYDCSVP